jgi:LEA14-like dessication related protein
MISRPLRCWFGAICLFLFAGCAFFRLATTAKLKKPTLDYAAHEVVRVAESHTDLMVRFKAHNPNSVGLKNVFVSYELFTEGKRFLRGDSLAVDLAPNGDSPIAVPAQVIYLDVLRALGPAAEKVLSGSKTLPVTIKATLTGKPTLYNEIEEGSLFGFTLDVSRTVEVPIPRKTLQKAAEKQIRKSLRKMF